MSKKDDEQTTPVIETEVEVEVKEKPVPGPQDVQLVFDADVAERWLVSANARLVKVFRSVQFEPDGMPEEQLGFLLGMAANSILGAYKVRRKAGVGVFYCPAELAGNPALNGFRRGEKVGRYVAFYREN